jgi:uncharacterized protein YjgD (DUF1641 family)
MTNRIFSAVLLLVLVFFVVGCGGNKYGDAIELNERFVGLMEEYVVSLEKSASAKEVIAAMSRFADGMEVLGPKMKEMAEKYPEWRDKNSQPEALKPSQEKVEEVAEKFQGSIMKIMPHMRDPEVQAAFKRVSAAMKTMT